MKVKIITDSAADLSEEIIKKYDIEVVPFSVRLEEKEFLDGKEISSKEVLQGMRDGNIYKTAQVSPQSFYETFSKYAESHDFCIYIGFSSKLSGTYQTSVMIKNQIKDEYPDFNLEVIDSRCASLGQGLVVIEAAKILQNINTENLTRHYIEEDFIKKIEFLAQHMEHIFTVDDLEYLYRGGRISKSKAFMGGLLNIKPILEMDKGELKPLKKVRGRKKVYKKMLDIVEERGVKLSDQVIGISHGDDLEGAEVLKEMVQDKFGCDKFVINILGSTISAHAGPGTLSLFFLNNISYKN